MCLATSRSRLLVTSLELVTEESVHNMNFIVYFCLNRSVRSKLTGLHGKKSPFNKLRLHFRLKNHFFFSSTQESLCQFYS